MPTPFTKGSYVRHLKTDGEYKVLGQCFYEPTAAECYLYQGPLGKLGVPSKVWARPVSEMEDGRFILIKE